MPIFEEKRDDKLNTVAVWAVSVKIPAFEEFAEKNFYWSTSNQFDLGDGNVYQGLLKSCRGRHQRDRGNDYAEFVVGNPNSLTYQDIYTHEDLIEKAEITVRQCFEIEDGYFESEIIFFGYLADFTVNDKEKSLDFTANSDLSRNGFSVGGRILTRERCGAEFNYNGVENATYHLCGWQTIQGGNATFCTRYLKGIDGCEAHNNDHRFYAVTGLVETPIQIVPVDVSPTGFDYETRPCFTPNTLVLMADWTVKPIDKVLVGEKVMGFDVFDNDKLVESEVLDTFKHLVDEVEVVTFSMAILETTKDHLFYLGKALFAPVKALGNPLSGKRCVGLDKKRKAAEMVFLTSRTSFEKATVFNLHTSSHNYIVCDRFQRFYFFVHNAKSDYYFYYA